MRSLLKHRWQQSIVAHAVCYGRAHACFCEPISRSRRDYAMVMESLSMMHTLMNVWQCPTSELAQCVVLVLFTILYDQLMHDCCSCTNTTLSGDAHSRLASCCILSNLCTCRNHSGGLCGLHFSFLSLWAASTAKTTQTPMSRMCFGPWHG